MNVRDQYVIVERRSNMVLAMVKTWTEAARMAAKYHECGNPVQVLRPVGR